MGVAQLPLARRASISRAASSIGTRSPSAVARDHGTRYYSARIRQFAGARSDTRAIGLSVAVPASLKTCVGRQLLGGVASAVPEATPEESQRNAYAIGVGAMMEGCRQQTAGKDADSASRLIGRACRHEREAWNSRQLVVDGAHHHRGICCKSTSR